MANSTRARVSMNTEVFHRIGVSGDMVEHDVGTKDTKVLGMGGSGDFEFEADTTVGYQTAHQVVNDTEAVISADATAIQFIYIKNTGFTSAAKTTEVAADSYITIGIGGVYADGGFGLLPGEAICFRTSSGATNAFNEIYIDSSVAATYVEILAH